MLKLSYLVNLAVLIPLLAAFWRNGAGMDPAFGPDSDARRILVSVYAAIAIVSAIGLALDLTGRKSLALSIGVGLFSVQVIYKLLTVVLVGLTSPVVLTNLAVVAVHCVTLAVVGRRWLALTG